MQILMFVARSTGVVMIALFILVSCRALSVDSSQCSRAMINPALTSFGPTEPLLMEGLGQHSLFSVGFQLLSGRYVLKGYRCYAALEWIDDKNLTITFYLPNDAVNEIPESIQMKVRRQLIKLVAGKQQLEVRDEIRQFELR